MSSAAHRPSAKPNVTKGMPDSVRTTLADRWAMFRQKAAHSRVRPPHHPDFLESLFRVWVSSDFVTHSCISHPDLLVDLTDSGDLLSDYAPGEMLEKVQLATRGAQDLATLSKSLRELRRREIVRIAWRDLAGWVSLEEVLADLSDLADACVQTALQLLHRWQYMEFGVSKNANDIPQKLVVLAMGKLGARELNFSSDIDLIFAYPESVQPRLRRGATHEEFYNRLGQNLIQVLSDTTEFGFVFRVDMRLRPYGDSGPLVMSFDAVEEYYQLQGREWERYAMIKARPITGTVSDQAKLMQLLQPFVYRRYLDFGAIEALRELKKRVLEEVRRKRLEDDIKLGPGGIREVEFIAQSFQLVRGGREPGLRERGLLKVLALLSKKNYLPGQVAERLASAYCFLRKVENRLQAFADRQTHRLPKEENYQWCLAYSMGFPDWDTFDVELRQHRNFVVEQFAEIFAVSQLEVVDTEKKAQEELSAVWLGNLSIEDASQLLDEWGYDEPGRVAELLLQLREGYCVRSLSSRGRGRMDRLVPLLLAAIAKVANPAETLVRIIGLLEAIAGRSAYLSLLADQPLVLSQLVRLCGTSAWMAELVTRHPLLLDDLIDPRTLNKPLCAAEFGKQLERQLANVSGGDLERQMEVLREEQQSAVLRTAVAETTGAISVLEVCAQLTMIAEEILGHVLRMAWDYLVGRHGVPCCGTGQNRRVAQFAIIGYGKLGGKELGYGSDLDLVFLHDSTGRAQSTDGGKSIDNAVFFARLGQRVIHLINTQTPAGVLYEIDMRLRPSGASGLLVSDLESYQTYQKEEAWTWEHQALVRARMVVGGDSISGCFAELRRSVLQSKREPKALREEVCTMRERMRNELGAGIVGYFDLKQDSGGVADIEFMVQYGALLWSGEQPDLCLCTDNVGLLEGFAATGVMDKRQAESLSEAYQQYLARMHQLALEGRSHVVKDDELQNHRQAVTKIWARLMQSD